MTNTPAEKTIEQIEQESLDQVVYLGMTRRTLLAAFNRVENKQNWKMPIDAVLPANTPVAELNTIIAAIGFFAGSEAEIIHEPTRIRVTAPGYYRSVGA